MKIAIIAPSPVPYCIGGAEKLWWGLLDSVHRYTSHQAELIKFPSPERNFKELISSYQAFSQLNLSHFDLVISTKYPAWMVHHQNHTVYLQHRLRGLYDTYPSRLSTMPGRLPPSFSRLLDLLRRPPQRDYLDDLFGEITRLMQSNAAEFSFPGPLTRQIIHHLDGIGLSDKHIRRYLAISKTVVARENYFPKEVQVEILHHPEFIPLKNPLGQHTDTEFSGNVDDGKNQLTPAKTIIFTVSRLDGPKRVDLLVKAFLKVKGDVEFHIAGTGPDDESLRKLAKNDSRIHFLGWLTDDDILCAYKRCLFVPFVPEDEDYGLITVEAMRASKPVLTTDDSGGVNELVRHGENGLVVKPTVPAIAGAMQQLVDAPQDAIRMGQACKETVAPINWEKTIDVLLRPKPLIVVTTTFPVYPPKGGGQSRMYHLYRHLSRHADIVLLTLVNDPGQTGEITIQLGLREIRVLKSRSQQTAQWRSSRKLKASIDDICAIDYTVKTPEYRRVLESLCVDANLVVVSHPYLYPEVRKVWKGDIWYEAHNVEVDIKADILNNVGKSFCDQDGVKRFPRIAETESIDEYLAKLQSHASTPHAVLQAIKRVWEVESACCGDARKLLCVSREDGERLKGLYENIGDLVVVPNGVDLASTPFSGVKNRQENKRKMGLENKFTALFMGSWHGPNIEAVDYIIGLAAVCPNVDFLLIGSVCNSPLPTFPVNMYCLGVVSEEEKATILGFADVAINPMKSGSGTNLKMLDFAAAGLLILTTPFGNRGLKFVQGKHLLVEELGEFSIKINELAEQGISHYESQIQEARVMAENHYSWEIIATDLSGEFRFDSLVENRKKSAQLECL